MTGAPQPLKIALAALVLAWSSEQPQTCLTYGIPVKLRGELTRVNEYGYWDWSGILLDRPICTMANPAYSEDSYAGIRLLQVWQGDTGRDIRELAGAKVEVTGHLMDPHTGYCRTGVCLLKTEITGTGLTWKPAREKDIAQPLAYDIETKAGRYFSKRAWDSLTGKPLIPVDEYAVHWMTGGEVVYLDCRDGYERAGAHLEPPHPVMTCDDPGELCGFNAFEGTVARMHCVKKDK